MTLIFFDIAARRKWSRTDMNYPVNNDPKRSHVFGRNRPS